MLIAFAGYLQSAQFDPGSVAHTRFPDWMVARAELRRWVQGLMGGRRGRDTGRARSLMGGGGGGAPGQCLMGG